MNPPVPGIPSLPRRQPVAEQEATDASATIATEATASGSGSSRTAAGHLAMDGAHAGLGLRRRPVLLSGQEANEAAASAATPGAPATNNLETWMAIDGVLYTCIITVLMGIDPKDLFGSWDTWAIVAYGVTMTVDACSFGGGLMALSLAFMMGSRSSSYRLYRSISGFCARFGFILCMILLVFYITCSMGRLGWIAGLLFSAVVGGAMTGLWVWAEKKPVAAEAITSP